MYFIGYDIGSSSVKAALVEASTGNAVLTLQEPENEMRISAIKSDWAEQNPLDWWKAVCKVTKNILQRTGVTSAEIKGIGISYQMHGLVILDKKGEPVRDAIIWCDSRAVDLGNKAFLKIGVDRCLEETLNSPANFTASKMAWVKQNEESHYKKAYKLLLPGDYIAFRFSGKMNTTPSGLSEGVLWNFKNHTYSKTVLDHFGLDTDLIPEIVDTFSFQSEVSETGEKESGLKKGTPIVYRAGDQANNALSLNVFNPGEIAATGGTSGVIYAVSENLKVKEGLKFNNFAHVNHKPDRPRIGKLLCINGTGIQYRWLKENLHLEHSSYQAMNEIAAQIPVGSGGVQLIPFGNGAERMFNNKIIGTHILNLNLNKHSNSHIIRAALEGIAFSFVYGLKILQKELSEINIIKAGNDNLFRSEIFSNTVATLTGQKIEIFDTTGAIGAARAAGLTLGFYDSLDQISNHVDHVMTYHPLSHTDNYLQAYDRWENELKKIVSIA